MPETLHAGRLTREELDLLQRKVMREWRNDDKLAATEPRKWLNLANDGAIRVALSERPEPGYLSLKDLHWPLVDDCLPCEDQSIDHILLHDARHAQDAIRALRTGGTITVPPIRTDLAITLVDLGLNQEAPTVFRKTASNASLDAMAPLREREVVLGDVRVPHPRLPT